MTKGKTLRELNVRPGDVVECVEWRGWTYEIGDIVKIDGTESTEAGLWRIISRASEAHKPWRDMTAEEKGALLLAYHNGEVIEVNHDGGWADSQYPTWCDYSYYRVRHEPKVETVRVYGCHDVPTVWGGHRFDDATHRITFNLIDGTPDTSSIRMEDL